MPYSITRHSEDLVWVIIEGHLAFHHAETFRHEIWAILDGCEGPVDLLVDGRKIGGAAPGARRHLDQIANHPRLGHLAFVVGEFHVLLFAPLVKLVSGIGIFGHEQEALTFLRSSRGSPPLAALDLPEPPHPGFEAPAEIFAEAHEQRSVGERPQPTRSLPPRPASRLKQTPLFAPHHAAADNGSNLHSGAGDGTLE